MDSWLTVDASRLSWRRELDLGLDVDAFEDTLARADAAERAGNLSVFGTALVEAVGCYPAELLPGCYADLIAPDRDPLPPTSAPAVGPPVALLEGPGEYRAA